MSWYFNEKPDDFIKVSKGLNEPVNMLITFMVSIWKIMGLNLTFSGSRENLPLKHFLRFLYPWDNIPNSFDELTGNLRTSNF